VAVSYLKEGQNINFCIPIDEISNMEPFESAITLGQFSEILKVNQ
jgi:hypothetical protein